MLEKALVSREIGSLFIGQGRRMRQLFLAGNEVYLVGAGRELRFCPLPFVLDGTVVPPSELDIVLGRFGSAPQSLSIVLAEDYDLSKEQQAKLLRHETIEEALMILETGSDRFVFETGTVPEEILLPGDNSLTPVPNSVFHKALRKRVSEQQLIEQVFPHPDELLVMTGEGSAKHVQGKQWLFSRVADLVDGFRDLNRIQKDSLFSPHLTNKLLSAAASRGWIRKKRFPEFENLKLEKLTESDLAELARRIEAAIPLAADEIPLRRKLAEVLERHGDRSQLLSHRIAIGDQLVGRKEFEQALEAYREAVEIAPRSPDACSRLSKLLEHFADESLARGANEEGRRFLEEALPLRPHDESIHLRIVQSHGSDESGASRAATRLAGMLHQDGQGERALRFLHLALQSYPSSDVLRRTYINFLLDHGLSEHALRELEILAQELLRRGHDEEARQIFEKIVRLDPDRVPQEQRAKIAKTKPLRPDPVQIRRRVRRSRKRRLVAAVTLAMIGVGIYQGRLWERAGQIQQRADALMTEPTPEVGSPGHLAIRKKWQDVIEQARQVRDGHPLQVASLRIDGDQESWSEQLNELETEAEKFLDGLLRRARLAEIQGSVEEARRLYHAIAENASNVRWKRIANEKLQDFMGSHAAATELRSRADVALQEGNRDEAFRLYRELTDLYPSAEASADVLLPVRLVSVPAGLEIFIDGDHRGTSPLDLSLVPFQPIEISSHRGDTIVGTLRLDHPTKATIKIEPAESP